MESRQPSTIKQNALASAALLALVVWWYRRVLFEPGLIIGDDSLASFYHVLSFGAGQMRAGHMPWWCPHIYCGVPFVASLMAPVFHPVMLLFLALRVEVAYHLVIVLQSWLGGTFMLLYLRQVGLPLFPAFFGSLALIFSGWVVTDAYHYERVGTFLHLPAVMFCIERALCRGGRRWYALAGVAAALQMHMTNVQIALYCDAFAAAYFVVRSTHVSAFLRKAGGQRGTDVPATNGEPAGSGVRSTHVSAWRGAVLAAVVAVGLSAPLVFPTLAYLPHTTRAARDSSFATSGSLPPEELCELFMRNPFGYWRESRRFVVHPGKQRLAYWGRAEPGRLHSEYLGMMACVLAVVGLAASRRRRLRWFSVAAAGAMLLLAVGNHTPLYGWLVGVVPGGSLFRGPAKWTLIAVFPLSVLAALGAEVVLCESVALSRRRVQFLLATLAAAGGVAGVGGPIAWREGLELLCLLCQGPEAYYGWGEITDYVKPTFWAMGGWCVACAVALLIVTWLRERPRWRAVGCAAVAVLLLADVRTLEHEHLVNCPGKSALLLRPDKLVDAIREHWPGRFLTGPLTYRFIPNKAMTVGLDTPDGYLPYRNQRYRRLFANEKLWDVPKFYDLLAVNVFVTTGEVSTQAVKRVYNSFEDDRLNPPFPRGSGWGWYDSPMTVFRRPQALPRAFLVTDYVVCPVKTFMDRLAAGEIDPAQTVALESTPADMEPRSDAGPLPPVEIVRLDAHERAYRVDCPTPAILVMSEVWDAGWQAAVDGEPTEVLRANAAFQAAIVPAGAHEIRLWYRPPGFGLGLGCALIAAALAAWAVARPGAMGRDSQKSTPAI